MTLNVDIDAIANRMHYRARSGEFCGNDSEWERRYIKKCSMRVGTTTLILTRDVGNHRFGWLSAPEHDRCLHLSIACRDDGERDAWLRAFFAGHVEELWGMPWLSSFGQPGRVWHWRLFCDESWHPLRDVDRPSLLAAGMRTARALGVSIESALAA